MFSGYTVLTDSKEAKLGSSNQEASPSADENTGVVSVPYCLWKCVPMWILSWIKLSWHTWSVWNELGWLNWFWQFLCEGLSSFNLKGFCYSYAWSGSLCEGATSFCMGLISRKLCRFLLMFSSGFTSLRILLLFPLLIAFIFMHGF